MIEIDESYLQDVLLQLLRIHSPTGYTDPIVRFVCNQLDEIGVEYELTRRGAIRATLPGRVSSPDRAIVAHLDTLGAMVKGLKDNGRLEIVPVGTWSSRFAEGARVSIFTDDSLYRGTILPLKASGHVYNEEVDTQPVAWENLEVRIDAPTTRRGDVIQLGFNVGDFIGIDAMAEILPNGYINSRHLDDKAGVACLLAAIRSLQASGEKLEVDCHLLFTISEEVGIGASAVLHRDVAEMVSIDNATCAPGQNSDDLGVTIAIADSSGPFDYHLTHRLLHLCQEHGIRYARDIFKHYRCDSASAVEAGNDIRTGLITFGVDASHGYERTHLQSLKNVARLVVHYAESEPMYQEQSARHNTLKDFPKTRLVEVDSVVQEDSEPVVQVPPEKNE